MPDGTGGGGRPVRTLVVRPPALERALAPWLAFLEASGQVAVTVTADLDRLTELAGIDVVVAHTTEGPLGLEQEAGLCDFVERGGGFVGLHGTTQAWSASPRYLALVGCPPNGRFVDSELRTRVRNPDHPLTRGLVGPLALREAAYGLAGVDPDCEVLLETDWQYRSVPVAYVRAAGRGRIFYCGAGGRAATLREPTLQRLLYRAVRYTAGRETGGEVAVGLLGTGAIAAEHAAAIAAVPGLRLGAVCDRSPERLAAARALAPAAAGHADAADLLADAAVDLVVVSTPPSTHAELTLRALAAGKHVVVEKPLCLTTAEADRLIAAATAAQRTLTVYQSRRWDPDFLAIRRVVAEGRLGDLFHAETFVGGFGHPCSYWHSHQAVSGGVVYDWGSHYIDWLLELFPGRVVGVSAWRQKRLWHDVTNDDQVRVLMTFDDGAQAEFLHSDIAAARKPKWYLLGTAGAVVGHWREPSRFVPTAVGTAVEERWLPTDAPAEVHVLTPDGEGGAHDQRLSLPRPLPQPFYRNLAGHLLAGEPLAVPPAAARRNIVVMEAATRSALDGGRPVAVDV